MRVRTHARRLLASHGFLQRLNSLGPAGLTADHVAAVRTALAAPELSPASVNVPPAPRMRARAAGERSRRDGSDPSVRLPILLFASALTVRIVPSSQRTGEACKSQFWRGLAGWCLA
jgi:hypothetical protein